MKTERTSPQPLTNFRSSSSSKLSLRMSQAVNINNFSGAGQIDGRCVSCLRISHRVALSPGVSCGHAHVRFTPKQCASKSISFICKASYSGHRRNPDFNNNHRQRFSERDNLKKEGADSSENLEHHGNSSMTDGLVNSLTSTPRFKDTETPGPREKEIVELFRKIQVQIRERTTFKEQKKMESVKGMSQEKGTVDSLLKLLRRHSTEQGIKKLNGNPNFEFDTENHPVQNGAPNGLKNADLPNASNHTSYELTDPNASSSTRPVSYFRLGSPISQAKNLSPPANRRRSSTDCKPYIRSKSVTSLVKHVREPVTELTTDHQMINQEPVINLGPVNMDDSYEGSDEEFSKIISNTVHTEVACEEEGQVETSDLSTLKVTDLRSIARSHGLKGFSKLKKNELVDLLGKSSLSP